MYTEKRKADRVDVSEEVQYSRSFYDHEFVPRWAKEVQTTSLNESPQGICIYTSRCLPAGTRLRLGSPHWSAKREGTVKWCKSSGKGLFKTGLALRN